MPRNKELLSKAHEILFGIDGYNASDFEKIGQVMDLLKQVQLPEEEIVEHDPTKEESEILQAFGAEFYDLMSRYISFEDIRAEVLRNAAISDAETWFEDILIIGTEDDDDED